MHRSLKQGRRTRLETWRSTSRAASKCSILCCKNFILLFFLKKSKHPTSPQTSAETHQHFRDNCCYWGGGGERNAETLLNQSLSWCYKQTSASSAPERCHKNIGPASKPLCEGSTVKMTLVLVQLHCDGRYGWTVLLGKIFFCKRRCRAFRNVILSQSFAHWGRMDVAPLLPRCTQYGLEGVCGEVTMVTRGKIWLPAVFKIQ